LRIDAATALGIIAKPSDKDTITTLQSLTDKKSKAPRGLKMAANASLKKIKSGK
jgi:hypothetical protein